MQRRRSIVYILAAVLLISGCASGGGGGTRTNPNLITAEQIAETNTSNMYDAVQRLRPNWMQGRGMDTVMGPQANVVVYLDNGRLGGVETLRQINVAEVTAAQYFNPTDAVNRYGIGHEAGAIVVRTR